MKIATCWSTDTSVEKAVRFSLEQLKKQLGASPDLIFIHHSEYYDAYKIDALLHELSPNVPYFASTSCLGVMTEVGLHSENDRGIGFLGILDPAGVYGVGGAEIEAEPAAAAVVAAKTALMRASRVGEVPEMIWISGAPGHEENLLTGIASLFGPNVPVGGGSSADNKVAGSWSQSCSGQVFQNGVIVATLFPSTRVSFAFHNGYDPTGKKAIVTRASGHTVFELDGKPAAEVYNQWIEGGIQATLGKGGSILMQTTFSPLGRVAGTIHDVPHFQLAHPDSVTPDNALTLFSEMTTGDEVFLMKGTKDSLVSRVSRVMEIALKGLDGREPAGALVVYCAGCMLSVRDKMPDVVNNIKKTLPEGIPFLGTFTFGEQGCFPGGKNRHGNLMISILVFSK